jgi:hypothetical protein
MREALEYDRNGSLICNTVGDPLEVDEDIRLTVLRIGRNVATHSFIQTARFRNSVNAQAILGAPAETLWLREYRANHVIQGERNWWREELEIIYNHLPCPAGETAIGAPSTGYIGWARRLANVGLRVWEQVSGVWMLKHLRDSKNEPLTDPVPVNTAGTAQLAKGAATIWLYYNTKRAVDWAPLRLTLG